MGWLTIYIYMSTGMTRVREIVFSSSTLKKTDCKYRAQDTYSLFFLL